MQPTDALQMVKKDLEGTFGVGLTSLILMTARTKSSSPAIGLSKDHFVKVIESISLDPRVSGMLGTAGAKEKVEKWKRLI